MDTQSNRRLPPLPAPRTLEFDLRITVPADAPMVDLAQALTQLAAAVGGSWRYGYPPGAERGRFEVEVRP